METALKIHVTGIVQGVGFRPFVYRQAQHYLIKGWVLNSADGVHIHAEGDENLVDEFCLSLSSDAPAASKVEQIEMKEVPLEDYKSFTIKHSKNEKTSQAGDEAGQTLISPDLATCDDCLKELFDKTDRRYRYPFINCTNCGPRFTIIEKLPYDRPYTSMSKFQMCDACQKEYGDPIDRRFHAQPDACFDCGPYVSWCENKNIERLEGAAAKGESSSPFESLIEGKTLKKSDEIFSKCVEFLKGGKIVAIKGLGGFHLSCDATNTLAVQRLRKRKMRSNKAFAIIAKDIDAVKQICHLNQTEEDLLTGPSRPIVLLKKKSDKLLSSEVSMGLPEIGVMLPYTPVQHILMHDYESAGGKYLVMTSGNVYDNPIVTNNEDAKKVFANIADAILANNRDILARYDDSVVRVIDAAGTEAIQVIRRTRGQAPMPIKINHPDVKEAFATGPEQKNSFAFMRKIPNASDDAKQNAEVFVSQHIGDMDNADVDEAWNFARRQYKEIFKFKPSQICCDMHPEYLTTKWADKQKLPVKRVQHHYAHIRSVMYENALEGPVLGFAFDGTGYGVDGQIWGGEILLCNLENFERFANFSYVPMPGGQAAITQPLRMAYGALWVFDLLEHPIAIKQLNFVKQELSFFEKSIEQGINTPYTSSVGRLFDAASALLDVCAHPTYEGEAAIMLEAKLAEALRNSKDIDNVNFDNRYEIKITKNVANEKSTAQDTSVLLLDPADAFRALLDDLDTKVELGQIIKNFHDAFVRVILTCSQLAQQLYGITDIALSGGVFMNRYLTENTVKTLVDNGFSVALNREVPPNDGGLSLGQL